MSPISNPNINRQSYLRSPLTRPLATRSMNHWKFREVLECGGWPREIITSLSPRWPQSSISRGWRGTGLTPLSMDGGRISQARQGKSGVCPHPSPTAVQDAGAAMQAPFGSWSRCAVVRLWRFPMNRSADLRSGAGKAALKPPALQTLRAAVAAPLPRVSVWSAGGFSAALALGRVQPRVQGFKARKLSGKSLLQLSAGRRSPHWRG